MLIALDSPLRKIPARLDRKQTLFFDGVRYAAEMSHLAFTRLLKTLHALPEAEAGTAEYADLVTAAMTDAWTIVDSTHRLRELLAQFPKLKQKLPNLQVFYRATTGVETFRNVIQHLRGEIDKLAENGLPVWGSLTWRVQIDPATGEEAGFGVCAGTFYPGASIYLSQFGDRLAKPIGRVCLNMGMVKLDLGELIRSIEPVIRFLEKGLAEQLPNEPHNAADALIQIIVKPTAGKPTDTTEQTPQ